MNTTQMNPLFLPVHDTNANDFFHLRKSSTCGIIDEEVEQTTSLIAETSIAATGEPFAKRKHTNEENDKDAPVEEPVPSTSFEKDTGQ